jgi:hypothetical protein
MQALGSAHGVERTAGVRTRFVSDLEKRSHHAREHCLLVHELNPKTFHDAVDLQTVFGMQIHSAEWLIWSVCFALLCFALLEWYVIDCAAMIEFLEGTHEDGLGIPISYNHKL